MTVGLKCQSRVEEVAVGLVRPIAKSWKNEFTVVLGMLFIVLIKLYDLIINICIQ